jgi:hypothetical protein
VTDSRGAVVGLVGTLVEEWELLDVTTGLEDFPGAEVEDDAEIDEDPWFDDEVEDVGLDEGPLLDGEVEDTGLDEGEPAEDVVVEVELEEELGGGVVPSLKILMKLTSQ